jgi:integrase
LRRALEALPQSGRRFFPFISEVTGRPIADVTLGGRVVALAKKAGVKLTMRSLRRGFGCRHAGKVSAHVLQRLMRHSNISITMDYYANIDQAVEEAILGPQGNRIRNSPGQDAPGLQTGVDATPSAPTASADTTS